MLSALVQLKVDHQNKTAIYLLFHAKTKFEQYFYCSQSTGQVAQVHLCALYEYIDIHLTNTTLCNVLHCIKRTRWGFEGSCFSLH